MEGGTPTSALRDVQLAGHFITFSLCLSVARIDKPPLQPAALGLCHMDLYKFEFLAQDLGFQHGAPTADGAEEGSELYSKRHGSEAHELNCRAPSSRSGKTKNTPSFAS